MNFSLTNSTILSTITALLLIACSDKENFEIEDFTTLNIVPTISIASNKNYIDLSNYKETGKYNLPIPDTTSTNLLAEEASAVTYNKDTDTLFILGDGSTAIVQVTKDGKLIDSMTLASDSTKPQGTDFYDTEGIAYIGNGEFALSEERYRQVSKFTYVANTTLNVSNVKTVKLGTTIGNIGMEGLSFDSQTDAFIAVKETDPLGIFLTEINFDTGTASNGSPTTENSVNMFDPAKIGMSAINDVAALSNVLPSNAPDYDQILIVSAKEGKVVKIDREGNIQSTLDVGVDAQHEGLTIDSDKNIYVVNEVGGGDGHPQMFVYTPSCEFPTNGSNICLEFNQTITAGQGNIIIDNAQGDKHSISITDPAVSFTGNTMTINLSNLVDTSTYTITYDAGVLKQGDKNIIAVSNNSLQFNSSGAIDSISPILESSIPEDNTINFSANSIIFTFNEAVIAGTGNVVISDNNGVQVLIDITDTELVRFGGKNVVVTPSTTLALGSSYNIQISEGVIIDLAGNNYTGINDSISLNFETATPAVPKLLITEVNSKATGGDFYELYNFGAAAVDLTGWKYTDSKADLTSTASFPDSTKIEAGEVLIAILGTDDIGTFKTTWGIGANVNIIAFPNGEKLGKGDAVVIYDETNTLAASFNYTLSALGGIEVSKKSDGTALETITAHAGRTFGDANTSDGVSAVWNGVSTSNPAYKAATINDFGSKTQTETKTGALSISTPGSIPIQNNTALLISEVNSKSDGGDFFELYNFGTASLNLSQWTYDDDSASINDGAKFPEHVVIPAESRLIVNLKQTTEIFKSIWNISEAGSYILLESGSGLGKGDAVVLFDSNGQFITGLNYGTASIPVLDINATQIATLNPAKNTSGDIPTETLQVGKAFGNGTDYTSAVWDGISTSDVRYTPAVVGVNNAILADDNASIASPGK
ncbi:MAG: hypothetical protein ACI9TV_002327 [Sulfurimonas sp.]|jgi:uncharacterized protein YjiK|uniref:SdiA-regulated domain-containing protein n=1 Tax=Sulfurimonas sp. TaxID=2022749 RepID=UPI0039E326FC